MSDAGENNSKRQRQSSQYPVNEKDEAFKKYINGVRMTNRIQEKRIEELEASEKSLKEQLVEIEEQLSEKNKVIVELEQTLAKQEKTIAQHEENQGLYQSQLASIKTFIDENTNKKLIQRVAYLEEEQKNFLETIERMNNDLDLKTEVISTHHSHIKLLKEKLKSYEDASSSQSSPPTNTRKGKSSTYKSKSPQTRDPYHQSILPFPIRPQTTSDSSQSSLSAVEFDRSIKRPLEVDSLSSVLNFGRRKLSIASDQPKYLNSSSNSLPSNSPKILSPIASNDNLPDMTRIKDIVTSRSQSVPTSDNTSRLTTTTTLSSQLKVETTNEHVIDESIIDISESLSQPTSSLSRTQEYTQQEEEQQGDYVDLSNTIPSLESTHHSIIKKQEDDTPSIKKQEEKDTPSIKSELEAEEQYDLTSFLRPTVPFMPIAAPSIPPTAPTQQQQQQQQQRKPLGNTTNVKRRPLGDATNIKGKSMVNTKARHQHGVGQTCMACDKFYDTEPLVDVENNNTILHTRDRIQLHSKHRSKNNHSRATTPPGFWDIDFTLSTQKK